MIRAILVNATDREVAIKAQNLLTAAVQRPVGAPIGNQNASRSETILDNIQDCPPAAPTGTSRDAGLRRLRKEAEAGNDNARDQLSEVLAGRKSVHRACVELAISVLLTGYTISLFVCSSGDPRMAAMRPR